LAGSFFVWVPASGGFFKFKVRKIMRLETWNLELFLPPEGGTQNFSRGLLVRGKRPFTGENGRTVLSELHRGGFCH
jgi:hypothetical protein